MIKGVIFDLDDTLISEKDYIMSGFNYLANELSPILGRSQSRIYNDLLNLSKENTQHVFNRLLEKYDIDYSKADILNIVNLYRNHFPDLAPYPDVEPILKHLVNHNFFIGLISDGYQNAQRKKFEAISLHKYFNKIIFTDELGREYWKPHPKAFEIMKKSSGHNYNELIYIGDNITKDFIAPNKLGMSSILLRRKTGVYREIKISKQPDENKPNFVISDLNELAEILRAQTE